jgi:hypothetical protein
MGHPAFEIAYTLAPETVEFFGAAAVLCRYASATDTP